VLSLCQGSSSSISSVAQDHTQGKSDADTLTTKSPTELTTSNEILQMNIAIYPIMKHVGDSPKVRDKCCGQSMTIMFVHKLEFPALSSYICVWGLVYQGLYQSVYPRFRTFHKGCRLGISWDSEGVVVRLGVSDLPSVTLRSQFVAFDLWVCLKMRHPELQ